VPLDPDYRVIPIGKGEILKEGKDLVILAVGSAVHPSLEAADRLLEEGISAGVVNARFIKPLDGGFVDLARSVKRVLVVEENARIGGFGSGILELLNEAGVENVRVKRIGLPDRFVEHGSLAQLRKICGLDASGIAKEGKDLCT
jgi:1-deoxy-D-xylulose-5-phosphate synthase